MPRPRSLRRQLPEPTPFGGPLMSALFDKLATPNIPANRVSQVFEGMFGGDGDPPPPVDKYHNGGRDIRGRFGKGNQGGPGNPFARQVAKLRQRFLDSANDEEIDFVKKQLM